MITYSKVKTHPSAVSVKLDGKIVGFIIEANGGWTYKPQGGEHGEVFKTFKDVKNSIESE